MKHKWKLYLDTSVFGGAFDIREGFDRDSRRVIDAVLSGVAELLYSPALEEELVDAPERVQALFTAISDSAKTKIDLTEEISELSQAYLDAGIVGPQWLDDTLHVAAATVGRADAIVSWNFKHIVRLDKIKGYNAVNLKNGYGIITIISPKEVDFDE
ncbi:type II toxin-antitoxin system VapC family toxin [Pontiella sulfatireligans]|nr:type II toxin-antitoxin system VapC family toxin [Pontiella sulfatireligans]